MMSKIKGLLNLTISFITFRFTSLNSSILRERIKYLGIDSLHIGCGNIIIPNWLNITLNYKEPYGVLKDKYILNCNLLKSWPIENNSIKFIAAAHFIEHLDLNDGIKFVKKCFISMQKGGFIRLSCPDLEIYARAYINKDKSFFSNPLIREACMFRNASTMGQIFAAKAYDHKNGHKWFYDFESLENILKNAGFNNIRKVSRTDGNIPFLPVIEYAKREIETVYIEAQKI